MKIDLIITKNEEVFFKGSFEKLPLTFGRAPDNDVVLDAPHISRHHARMSVHEEKVVVENLSSLGKIIFQNEAKDRVELKSGDSFSIPPFHIEIQVSGLVEEEVEVPVTHENIDAHDFSVTPMSFRGEETGSTQVKKTDRIGILESVQSGIKKEISQHSKFTIGRATGNSLHFEDDNLSRHHCHIIFEENQFVIEDLSSGNGTFVNDRHIQKHALKSGDKIRVGDHEFQFKIIDKRFYSEKRNSDLDVIPSLPVTGGAPFIPSADVVGLTKPRGKSKKLLYVLTSIIILLAASLYFMYEDKSQKGPKPASGDTQVQGKKFESLSASDKAKIVEKTEEALRLMNVGEFLTAIHILQDLQNQVGDYEKANNLLEQAKKMFHERNVLQSKQKQQEDSAKRKARELIAFEVTAAERHIQNRNVSGALDALNKAISYDPTGDIFPEAINKAKEMKKILLGIVEENKEQAVQKKVREAHINQVKNYLSQASTFKQNGNLIKAIEIYEKVLRYEGSAFENYRREARKNIEEAGAQIFSSYAGMIEGLDQKFELLFPKGRVLASEPTVNDLADLKNQYDSVVQKMPDVTFALRQQKEEVERKVSVLDKELTAHAKKQYYEALITESQGDIEGAIRLWRGVINTFDPSSEFVKKSQDKLRKYRK